MRIGLATGVWGRLFVTKLFYTAVARLRDQWAPHEVECYVAGEEPQQAALAKRYGAVWCPVPNNPLGAKMNTAAHFALMDGVDYLVLLGSDDLLSPDLAVRYRQRMEQGVRYAGLAGLRFINPIFNQAAAMLMYRSMDRRYEPVGPGRIISRDLLAELKGYPFFPLARKGLDWSMHQQIESRTEIGSQCDIMVPGDSQFVVDVKTAQNMWKFKDITKYGSCLNVSYRDTIRVFPAAERDMLYLIGQGLV